jgi:hypothetical protein
MSVKPGARQSYLLAGAALTVLGLAGCSSSSDSDPTSLPTLSPNASTASPAPSVSPSETGKKAELAAATAVVKRYYELLNAATTVENARRLETLMTPDCKCVRVAQSTRAVARRHRRYYGKTTLVAIRPSLDGPQDADVLVRYDYSTTGIETQSGEKLTSAPGRVDNQVDIRLRRSGSTWLISAVNVLSDGQKP